MGLPIDATDWLTVSADELVMRRCAYWVSLLGRSESNNQASVRVSIPTDNRFDPDNLRQLLDPVEKTGATARGGLTMATIRFDARYPLRAITPVALSYYARSEGWDKVGTYWEYSDVYAGAGKPEIIVPRTDVIDDYAMAVSDLIAVFARTLGRDEIVVYRDLTLADRDVMRIRAIDVDPEGLPFESSHAMLAYTRGMLVAAANSLDDDRPVYRPAASGQVANYLQRVRLGNTERGSFALVLVSPAVAPRLQTLLPDDADEAEPKERQVAQRLAQSLSATRSASERAVGGDTMAFAQVVASGVSANLCEAVAGLVEDVAAFDVSFSWAMTRPTTRQRGPVAFASGDVPLLREAARSFRRNEPEYDQRIYGLIDRLTRPQRDIDGTVSLRTSTGGIERSVTAVLSQRDYTRAIEARDRRALVCLEGDLERVGQRQHLRNARLAEVIHTPALPGLD